MGYFESDPLECAGSDPPTSVDAFPAVEPDQRGPARAKRPVIGSDVAGNPLAIVHGETGFIVPERNPAALADAIATLAENPQLRTWAHESTPSM